MITQPEGVARLDDIPRLHCERMAQRIAVQVSGGPCLSYAGLETEIQRVAAGLGDTGVALGDRIAIYLPKGLEAVVALFAVVRVGAVAVPINPALSGEAVIRILLDCTTSGLITSAARLDHLAIDLRNLKFLRWVVDCESTGKKGLIRWSDLQGSPMHGDQGDDAVAAILYTTGSSGAPKGVVLTHRNMVLGAKSVAWYLKNCEEDRSLAALPLSFDAGLSQVTTALLAGGSVVLLDYIFAADAARAIAEYRITGLTGVPSLWRALAALDWQRGSGESLRYFANTGGRLDRSLLARLREMFPRAEPFLMYGLTEAFRSTYLPPEQADSRPDSIGMAIPNAEVFVLREDGTECEPFEHGEIVHVGPLVAQGYWNGDVDSYARFGPAPKCASSRGAAVWSGDLAYRDKEGYLYFVGRRDEVIKISGHRVSPIAVEEAASDYVAECCAFGMERNGQEAEIWLAAIPRGQSELPGEEAGMTRRLLANLQARLPRYALPARVRWERSLPKDHNGKINRRAVRAAIEGQGGDL